MQVEIPDSVSELVIHKMRTVSLHYQISVPSSYQASFGHELKVIYFQDIEILLTAFCKIYSWSDNSGERVQLLEGTVNLFKDFYKPGVV